MHTVAPASSERRSIRDGRIVVLRSVHESDLALLRDFIAGLSPASRRRRFHGAVAALPERVLQRMTRPDHGHEFVLLALAPHAGSWRCVAEARYAAGDGPPGEREFAVAVADDWQGAGLGSTMLDGLLRHARAHGVERLCGDVMADNHAMIATARRNGFELARRGGDARMLRLSRCTGLPQPAAA